MMSINHQLDSARLSLTLRLHLMVFSVRGMMTYIVISDCDLRQFANIYMLAAPSGGFQLTNLKVPHIRITHIAFTNNPWSAPICNEGQVIGHTSPIHDLNDFVENDESCLQTHVSRNAPEPVRPIDVLVDLPIRQVFPRL